jgi:hypothetical protein
MNKMEFLSAEEATPINPLNFCLFEKKLANV